MKKAVSSFIFFLTVQSTAVWACGGGEPIVLNDDTLLTPNGLSFPITDPEGEKPLWIEERFKKYQQCLKEKDFASAAFGQACRMNTYVTDSGGKKTHKVRMQLEQGTATYVVTDLATEKTKVYEGQIGTRGGCGLQELR